MEGPNYHNKEIEAKAQVNLTMIIRQTTNT